MKIFNVKLCLLFIFASTQLVAEEYYLYKLFNDKFQVVLPSQPQVFTKNPLTYNAKDSTGKIAFSIQSFPTGQDYDIGKFPQSVKKELDNSIEVATKSVGGTLISFSSVLNSSDNVYMAIYSFKGREQNVWMYHFTKYIIYRRTLYKWTVSSYNYEVLNIFNDYQNNVIVLK